MKTKKILFAIIICIFSISCGITDNNGNQSSITKLYVTMQVTEEVAIYSTPDLTLLKTIYFDFTNQDFPHFIVLDEANGYWFVTIMESGWVAQFSLITDELIDTVYVGGFPALMTVNSDEKKLYVSRMMNRPEQDDYYVINEIDYSGNSLASTEIHLYSPILHAITMDYAKENLFTASNVTDWIYRFNINGDEDLLSLNMDITNEDPNPATPWKKLQPIQCIAINDSLIAITCSAMKDNVNGQVQIWNGNSLSWVSTYEFTSNSRPWHLIKSPIKDEVFVVLGGTTGNGGVASLTFAKNDEGLMTFEEKWQTPPNDEYHVLHGITIDALGKYIYVSGRGNHKLYKFDADDGDQLLSIPLESNHGTVISPAGLSIMQSPCINCE